MAEWNLNDNTLSHHGILGMKWGIRRFQPYSKGDKKGKEVGEAAKKPTLSRVKKAEVNAGIKLGRAINKKVKAKRAYKKHAKELLGDKYLRDRILFGKRGIKRILDKVDNKGKTVKEAERSETIRFAAKQAASIALSQGASYLITSGKLSAIREGMNLRAFDKANNIIRTTGYTTNADLYLPFKR